MSRNAAYKREKPREETEARLLRERGTPEELIGPVVPDGSLNAASMDDFERYCCGDPDCTNDCERETPSRDAANIYPARDPYPPSPEVAEARDAAIESASAEVEQIKYYAVCEHRYIGNTCPYGCFAEHIVTTSY